MRNRKKMIALGFGVVFIHLAAASLLGVTLWRICLEIDHRGLLGFSCELIHVAFWVWVITASCRQIRGHFAEGNE